MTDEAVKVIELRAENFKRLRAIQLRPDGAAVIVGGRNAQGKSSTLDAIWAALGGKTACPDDPIRHGEKRATIRLDLGDLIVTRIFKASGTKLQVVAKDGSKLSSPQRVLDKMIGALSFDPLDFARKPAKDQAAILRQAAGVDTSQIDAALAEALADRTTLGRIAKQARTIADALPVVKDPGFVDVSEIAEDLDRARRANVKLRDLQGSRAEKIEAIATLELQLEQARKDLAEIEKALEPLHLEPTEAMKAALDGATERNRQHAKAKEREEAVARAVEAEAEHEASEKEIAGLRQVRDKMLRESKAPIAGLEITDEGVTYNGVPLQQASSAERLRVSTAIGLALNPQIRIVTIRDGSLLDAESLAEIVKMAEEAGAQVWVERVGTGEEVGFIIEDGEIVGGSEA